MTDWSKALKLPYTGGNKVVEGAMLKTIAENNIPVIMNMGNMWWMLDGRLMPSGITYKDLSFGVTLGNGSSKIAEKSLILGKNVRYVLDCDVYHSGMFGFIPIMHIQIGKEYAGLKAALFKDGVFMYSVDINEDGIALFPVIEGGEYEIAVY